MINPFAASEPVSLEEYLPLVRKPARYIGKEYNACRKPTETHTINLALCFPDTYEIGMSHLGIKVLYEIINREPDVFCERGFAPWPDMQEMMRKHNIPLFTLETHRPVAGYDILGFSLQSELCYTNVLGMLDLAGIPLSASARSRHPLVIAGGPCGYNPRPMSEFIDVFFIGEAEELIREFLEIYREFKKDVSVLAEDDSEGFYVFKQKLMRKLATVDGLYLPRFSAADKKVKRRFVADLDSCEYFTNPPVPFVEIIHDRISLEIMRGCPNQCFFCQAGFTLNPVRVRKVETLIGLAKTLYANTGYDSVSFCALSSANYPHLKELITRMQEFCREKDVGISLPSLRVDDNFIGVISLLQGLKKTGLTFAPEAGSEKLRAVINKRLDIGKLKEAVTEAYRCGWQRIKLYFMIGLPGEDFTDLEEMVKLIEDISFLRRQIDGKRGRISVGISNFIPKAHTPFQWLGMDNVNSLKQKQDFLRKRLSGQRCYEVDFQDIPMSFLEACLCRGDADIGPVIRDAFAHGAVFDAWSNLFNPEIWQNAFKLNGIDMYEYAAKPFPPEAVLPWENIDCGIEKERLLRFSHPAQSGESPAAKSGDA